MQLESLSIQDFRSIGLIKLSFSKPININNNYLIIKVNQKRIINEEFDENQIVKEIIEIEKNKQYQNFSQIYFNKIKLNTQINEF